MPKWWTKKQLPLNTHIFLKRNKTKKHKIGTLCNEQKKHYSWNLLDTRTSCSVPCMLQRVFLFLFFFKISQILGAAVLGAAASAAAAKTLPEKKGSPIWCRPLGKAEGSTEELRPRNLCRNPGAKLAVLLLARAGQLFPAGKEGTGWQRRFRGRERRLKGQAEDRPTKRCEQACCAHEKKLRKEKRRTFRAWLRHKRWQLMQPTSDKAVSVQVMSWASNWHFKRQNVCCGHRHNLFNWCLSFQLCA